MRSFFFFQAEDGIRDYKVTGVQTCALPISFLDAWEATGDEAWLTRAIAVMRYCGRAHWDDAQGGFFDVARDRSGAAYLATPAKPVRSEEHTSELQSPCNLVCRLLLEKKKTHRRTTPSDRLNVCAC